MPEMATPPPFVLGGVHMIMTVFYKLFFMVCFFGTRKEWGLKPGRKRIADAHGYLKDANIG